MKKQLINIVSMIAIVLLTGCATTGDMRTIEQQLADLHDQIAELKRQASSKEEVQRLNQSLASQREALLKSNADLALKVAEIDEKLQNAQGAIEQTNHRIDRLVQQVTTNERAVSELRSGARTEGVNAADPSGGTTPIVEEVTVGADSGGDEDPLAIYQSAYSDYQRGNYDLAIEGFRDFLRNNPTSDLADNAAYWIGDSFFAQKKYVEAIQQFDSVIKNYSDSDKVPAALLKKGYAYMELGEKAQGIVQLQYVVHEHPRSNEAQLARQRLRTLGIETN